MVSLRGVALAARNIGLVFVLLLVAGATAQAVVERLERDRYPPPGRLVDVGGGRLIHLRSWGMENRGPALILDASGSYFSSAWAWYGRMLGDDYRVVAYDRPGMGWSIGRTEPRDARAAAEALRAALDGAGIAPPYVAVGHSFGGFSARLFAAMNRADVIGLVLLDTSHPDQGGGPYYGMLFRWRAWAAHAGLHMVAPLPSELDSLPMEDAEPANAVSRWTSHLDATAEELDAFDASAEQVRQAGHFGELPVLIVSAAWSPAHVALQRDLVGLSSCSRFVLLEHVGHVSMLTYEPHAADVVAEMRRFMAALDAPQRGVCARSAVWMLTKEPARRRPPVTAEDHPRDGSSGEALRPREPGSLSAHPSCSLC